LTGRQLTAFAATTSPLPALAPSIDSPSAPGRDAQACGGGSNQNGISTAIFFIGHLER